MACSRFLAPSDILFNGNICLNAMTLALMFYKRYNFMLDVVDVLRGRIAGVLSNYIRSLWFPIQIIMQYI